MNSEMIEVSSATGPVDGSGSRGRFDVWRNASERVEAVFVVLTLIGLVTGVILEARGAASAVVLTVHVATYLFGGFFATMEIIRAVRAFTVEVDMLMVLAALGAAYVDAWTEGATLLFLFSLSNVLQNYAMGRTHQAISALLTLRPDSVRLRRGRELVDVPLDTVVTDDVFVLRPGDRVALDGEIASGTGYFDESSVTGESLPVGKTIGDAVLAGTLNQSGAFDVRVSKPASESTLSRIITMVEDARERKAAMQSFLDRAEKYYAMGVIVLVALYIVGMSLLTANLFENVFYRAMVLLTVASPCALVISVPATVLSAIAGGARGGVLFKGGGYVEALYGIRTIAFDKTGTLTFGRPAVADVIPADGITTEYLLAVAARAEIHSQHPIARAIVRHAREAGIQPREPEYFEESIGSGVIAHWNGKETLIGSPRMMEARGILSDAALTGRVEELRRQGRKTVLQVQHDGEYLGTITVMDKERPDAAEQIQRLRDAGIQRVVMLTGDDETTARAMADRLGIDEMYAGLMPEDKMTWVEKLQERYGPVAMVGDGVNDAPALARSQVGIAMGAAGTDAALESADVVLMADDLGALVRAVRISRRARRVILQNVVFAMGVVVTLVVLTLTVGVPLTMGVVGHEGSTIIVVLNGLRLLRKPA
ncbi:MAG: heavy metal translocating P-type ATPase [Spirochaeta sp.]|jgi:Cd2+/Zn2+-exporting ATPase|nr:heavy metal translocating P-type ATPase [Spirochaeta sp.]